MQSHSLPNDSLVDANTPPDKLRKRPVPSSEAEGQPAAKKLLTLELFEKFKKLEETILAGKKQKEEALLKLEEETKRKAEKDRLRQLEEARLKEEERKGEEAHKQVGQDLDETSKQLAELTAQNDHLKSENKHLKFENDHLKSENQHFAKTLQITNAMDALTLKGGEKEPVKKEIKEPQKVATDFNSILSNGDVLWAILKNFSIERLTGLRVFNRFFKAMVERFVRKVVAEEAIGKSIPQMILGNISAPDDPEHLRKKVVQIWGEKYKEKFGQGLVTKTAEDDCLGTNLVRTLEENKKKTVREIGTFLEIKRATLAYEEELLREELEREDALVEEAMRQEAFQQKKVPSKKENSKKQSLKQQAYTKLKECIEANNIPDNAVVFRTGVPGTGYSKYQWIVFIPDPNNSEKFIVTYIIQNNKQAGTSFSYNLVPLVGLGQEKRDYYLRDYYLTVNHQAKKEKGKTKNFWLYERSSGGKNPTVTLYSVLRDYITLEKDKKNTIKYFDGKAFQLLRGDISSNQQNSIKLIEKQDDSSIVCFQVASLKNRSGLFADLVREQQADIDNNDNNMEESLVNSKVTPRAPATPQVQTQTPECPPTVPYFDPQPHTPGTPVTPVIPTKISQQNLFTPVDPIVMKMIKECEGNISQMRAFEQKMASLKEEIKSSGTTEVLISQTDALCDEACKLANGILDFLRKGIDSQFFGQLQKSLAKVGTNFYTFLANMDTCIHAAFSQKKAETTSNQVKAFRIFYEENIQPSLGFDVDIFLTFPHSP